jgi:hypothetical protein
MGENVRRDKEGRDKEGRTNMVNRKKLGIQMKKENIHTEEG